MNIFRKIWVGGGVIILVLLLGSPQRARGQETAAEPSASFSQEELDQMLAPLALYPDSLLTQVLMASTYPIEIVQADRFVKANPDLQGAALTAELERRIWDPSVKSLVNFPQVLATLSEQLEWTTKIGDAFIADQKRVLETIQKLRAKAAEAGNLQSNEQQTVEIQQEGTPEQVIVIESAEPDVVYVPAYNPSTVYGTWPYPAYPPPVYYQPPYYSAAASALAFGTGVAFGAAWGYAWGDADWDGGEVDIDVDRNINRNRDIDRTAARENLSRRNPNAQNGRGTWQHDASHRKGASYRDQATAERFGGTSTRDAARAREQYRGRAEAGRRDLGGSSGARRTAARDASGRRDSAFGDSRTSGREIRSASERGRSSRSAMSRGSGGGRSPGGFGGGRGGGGRGGGGRR